MLGDRFDAVLEAAQAGDADAFAELWRATQPMLLRYLQVLARQEADDIASHAWLRVMKALTSFSGNEPQFRRWVVTIARNLHRDSGRRAARLPETPVDDVADLSEVDRGAAPDASTEAVTRMSTESALRLIGELPPAQAEMVMLRVVMGLAVADVAAIVDKRPGAVRVAVHRALRSLEERLSRPPDPGDVTHQAEPTFSEHDA